MKRLTALIISLIVIIATINGQTIKSLFDKYSEDERFEYVSVGSEVNNIVNMNLGDTAMVFIKGLKILTLNDSNNTRFSKGFINELNQVVDKDKYQTLIEVRDKADRTNIYSKKLNDESEMIIFTQDDTSLSMIWITGKYDPRILKDVFDFDYDFN